VGLQSFNKGIQMGYKTDASKFTFDLGEAQSNQHITYKFFTKEVHIKVVWKAQLYRYEANQYEVNKDCCAIM